MTQEVTEQLSKTLSLLEKETGRARKAASVAAERVGALASAIDPRRLGRSGSEDKSGKDGKDGKGKDAKDGKDGKGKSKGKDAKGKSKSKK